MNRPMRTLLALFAHPDDESFASGGTLARYAHQGVRVVLGCATRGEAGVLHDGRTVRPADLGRIREQELRCACRALGVHDLRFLGYRDSGMRDSPDNGHAQAFINADPEQVVVRILALFREFRPQVVLTFGPDGGSGHPDHIAIHRHVTAAWLFVDDPRHGAELADDPPRKLYYRATPRHLYRRAREAMWQRGWLPQPPSDEEVQQRGWPQEMITTAIDVRAFLDDKVEALRCHRTQLTPDHPWLTMPLEFRREHFGEEHYILAAARGVETQEKEDDLFAGLP